jgi:hypothetical protein
MLCVFDSPMVHIYWFILLDTRPYYRNLQGPMQGESTTSKGAFHLDFQFQFRCGPRCALPVDYSILAINARRPILPVHHNFNWLGGSHFLPFGALSSTQNNHAKNRRSSRDPLDRGLVVDFPPAAFSEVLCVTRKARRHCLVR